MALIIAVCIDDNYGMMFNKRRQSQDSIIRTDLLQMCGGNRLYMNQYSHKQFQDHLSRQIVAEEDFLERAKSGDYCFVEDRQIGPFREKIEKMILYKWNRNYPGDFYLDVSPKKEGWSLESSEDLIGFSHEKITKEVYKN